MGEEEGDEEKVGEARSGRLKIPWPDPFLNCELIFVGGAPKAPSAKIDFHKRSLIRSAYKKIYIFAGGQLKSFACEDVFGWSPYPHP